ncbi:hypothetical protein [Methylobacterium sp. E-066]|uniref:hypothetical protein n=1 Tax=Methylobacterium sp. E-066 TaxID=2836584 RepID=UPI001FBB8542|nr:hypothetical protein [Methylobacterium sp. E-066]MCJ2139420.1 hypothetical protein [Methylobacterium sp. E-066]
MRFYLPAPSSVATMADAMGDHMGPLLLLAAHRQCALGLQDQDLAPFPVPHVGPWVAIIGDDPPWADGARGPGAFHAGSLDALMGAAYDVSIISRSEIVPDIYDRAAALAMAGHSSVIIETLAQHEIAWAALVREAAPGKLSFIACDLPAGWA